MACQKRPGRRSVSGLVRFEEPNSTTHSDATLFQLAGRMRVAEQAFHEAMDGLALAEQRFAALPEQEKRARQRPAWLVAAQDREATAGDALETIYRQLAETPAESKFGLAMKLQIIVVLYGENAGE